MKLLGTLAAIALSGTALAQWSGSSTTQLYTVPASHFKGQYFPNIVFNLVGMTILSNGKVAVDGWSYTGTNGVYVDIFDADVAVGTTSGSFSVLYNDISYPTGKGAFFHDIAGVGSYTYQLGNINTVPYPVVSSPVPNPNQGGSSYLYEDGGLATNFDIGIATEMTPNAAGNFFIYSDGGNSPASTEFDEVSTSGLVRSTGFSQSIPAPASRPVTFHNMAACGTYLYYITTGGQIYRAFDNVSTGQSVGWVASSPGLISSGNTLYAIYTGTAIYPTGSANAVFFKSYTSNADGSLTPITSGQLCLGNLVDFSLSSNGLYAVASQSVVGGLAVYVGWSGNSAPLTNGLLVRTLPSATTSYVDGIRALSGAEFVSTTDGFIEITPTLSSTSFLASASTGFGVMSAATSGTGYVVGRSYQATGASPNWYVTLATYL